MRPSPADHPPKARATDHSDPGVALIELFAWTAELLLFQMNRVPDLHYIKLMELMGIKLDPARTAQAPVTIWLSAPQPKAVSIAKGYEVASARSERTHGLKRNNSTSAQYWSMKS